MPCLGASCLGISSKVLKLLVPQRTTRRFSPSLSTGSGDTRLGVIQRCKRPDLRCRTAPQAHGDHVGPVVIAGEAHVEPHPGWPICGPGRRADKSAACCVARGGGGRRKRLYDLHSPAGVIKSVAGRWERVAVVRLGAVLEDKIGALDRCSGLERYPEAACLPLSSYVDKHEHVRRHRGSPANTGATMIRWHRYRIRNPRRRVLDEHGALVQKPMPITEDRDGYAGCSP